MKPDTFSQRSSHHHRFNSSWNSMIQFKNLFCFNNRIRQKRKHRTCAFNSSHARRRTVGSEFLLHISCSLQNEQLEMFLVDYPIENFLQKMLNWSLDYVIDVSQLCLRGFERFHFATTSIENCQASNDRNVCLLKSFNFKGVRRDCRMFLFWCCCTHESWWFLSFYAFQIVLHNFQWDHHLSFFFHYKRETMFHVLSMESSNHDYLNWFKCYSVFHHMALA